MGFLVDVQPFSYPGERRYFVAEREGALVGFLAAVPVYARAGWLFEDLLRDPQAPNGTSEALVDIAMRAVARQDSRYVTLGLSPLSGKTPAVLGLARSWAAPLYDFRGIHAFRAKLRPARWDPLYLCVARPEHPGPLSDWLLTSAGLWDALRAFARGGFWGFGVATLLRGRSRRAGALPLPGTAGPGASLGGRGKTLFGRLGARKDQVFPSCRHSDHPRSPFLHGLLGSGHLFSMPPLPVGPETQSPPDGDQAQSQQQQ